MRIETSKIHKLKILPEYFAAVVSGRKTFEIRFDDRNYHEGDTVELHEWNNGKYTGFKVTKTIGFITDFQQHPGFKVFSLK